MVEVRPAARPANANVGLEVILPRGERLQIFAGADAATLRMVLAVLRERG